MHQLSTIYYNFGDLDRAEILSKSAVSISTENIWYKFQLAEIYKKKSDLKKKIEEVRNELDYWKIDLPDKVKTGFDDIFQDLDNI